MRAVRCGPEIDVGSHGAVTVLIPHSVRDAARRGDSLPAGVQFGTAASNRAPLVCDPVTDRAELRRLLLDIDRATVARAQLQTLVTAAEATVGARRRDLRNLRARLRRAAARAPRSRQ